MKNQRKNSNDKKRNGMKNRDNMNVKLCVYSNFVILLLLLPLYVMDGFGTLRFLILRFS